MEIRDKKGAENLVANHLSRLVSEEVSSPINDSFLDEQLMHMHTTLPWFADIANYLVTKTFPHDILNPVDIN